MKTCLLRGSMPFLNSLLSTSKSSFGELGMKEWTKNMETTIMGCIGTTVRIHFFIPS